MPVDFLVQNIADKLRLTRQYRLFRHYFSLCRAFLRVATYYLQLMYMFVGFLMGLVINGPSAVHDLNIVNASASLLVAAVAIAFWYINGTALNDYADYEIDKINLKNDKDRPLVSGQAKRREVLNTALFSAGIALLLAGFVSLSGLVLMVLLLLLNVSYSLKPLQISRRGGLAPLLLPLGYIVLPFFLGFSHSGHIINREVLSLVAGLYLHFLGRIILKDYRDVKGDRANNKLTFLLRHGNRMVVLVSGFSILVSGFITVSIISEYAQYVQYAVLCLVFFGLTILYQLSLTDKWSEQKPLLAAFGRAMKGTTAALIFGLTAYLWNFKPRDQALITLVLIMVYVWSAQRALLYNEAELRRKK